MAEGIFNKIANERGGADSAASAGIFAPEGASASDNSIEAMREIGIDISEHCADSVSAEKLSGFDRVLTMTKAHADTLRIALPQFAEKISTLSEAVGEDGEIPDPFGGSLDDYRICRDEIKRLIEKL